MALVQNILRALVASALDMFIPVALRSSTSIPFKNELKKGTDWFTIRTEASLPWLAKLIKSLALDTAKSFCCSFVKPPIFLASLRAALYTSTLVAASAASWTCWARDQPFCIWLRCFLPLIKSSFWSAKLL